MKKIILGIFIGMLLMAGVGALAYSMNAKQIAYTPSDNTWEVSNVEGAINSLKTNQNTIIQDYKDKFDTFTVKFYAQSYNSSSFSNAQVDIIGMRSKYTKFKVTSVNRAAGSGSCTPIIWNGSAVDVVTNNEYKTSDYSIVYVRSKSSSTSECRCEVIVNFYN